MKQLSEKVNDNSIKMNMITNTVIDFIKSYMKNNNSEQNRPNIGPTRAKSATPPTPIVPSAGHASGDNDNLVKTTATLPLLTNTTPAVTIAAATATTSTTTAETSTAAKTFENNQTENFQLLSFADALKNGIPSSTSTSSDDNINDFTLVKNRRKPKMPPPNFKPVIGTRNMSSSSESENALKAGNKKAHIYVGRLHPTTSTTQITDHLRYAASLENVEIASVESKSDYAAFRLTCDFDNLNEIMNPHLWPAGTYSIVSFLKERFLQKQMYPLLPTNG
jgi:hypothetical protein